MCTVKVGSTFAVRRWRTSVLLFALGFALLLAQPVHTQAPPPDALQFFKNYFITGDYAVGGASLWRKGAVNGRAAVQISVPGVPDGVDILAAFLYVQTAETEQWSGIDHAKFNGADLGPGSSSVAKALNWDLATAPCWSVAWPGGRRMVTYRADVLRYLPIGPNGKQVVNGPHGLEVPDSGYALGDIDEGGIESGSGTGPRAVGASLVVVYRDPTKPLKAIVIYDGGFKKAAFATMNQTIAGFYQASTAPAAKMTHIVGDGGPLVSEKVLLNGELIATNPFVGAVGRKWDNPTFDGLPVPAGGASADVSVTRNGLLSDCLCYSGIVFSTEVQDSDGDGLLDVWESQKSETPGSLLQDPNGQPLPILGDMGADPMHKDVFIEIGYMDMQDADLIAPGIQLPRYGGVEKPVHSHLPTPAAIKLMGDAFLNAPVVNPDGFSGIKLHVDAGDLYPSGEADAYIIRDLGTLDLARGGEALPESITTPACTRLATDPVWKCQFQEYPGTVGWKTGFRYIRDEVIGTTDGSPIPPKPLYPEDDDPCDAPGSKCVRRFDANRMDMFHYAFFAHAVGMPKSLFACLDMTDPAHPVETPEDVNGLCPAPLVENPVFHTPRTNSGIGDFPGRDILVTLGAFNDHGVPATLPDTPATPPRPVGTDFMVASTFFHELGHNIELRHGAWQETPGGAVLPAPNCIPTYLSSMNYLYQLRGLLDDKGRPNLDFSSGSGSTPEDRIDEAGGTDKALSFTPLYRIGWYAPLSGSYLEGRGTPALRHCDGSDLLRGPTGVLTEVPMVRIDARTAAGAIDWNANGSLDGYSAQDLNFNGRTSPAGATAELPQAFNDWANIHLNQLGGARNVGGPFIDKDGHRAFGPLSADLARADWARADWARADWGRGDDGRGDLGGGDLFVGNLDNPGGELDFETATDLAKTPPNEFTACVIGDACAAPPATSGVVASWKASNIGGVTGYSVYRVPGNALLPGLPWEQVVGDTVGPDELGKYTLVDHLALYATNYTYFAVATYADGIRSDPSNLVPITTPKASSTVTVTCPGSASYTGLPQTPCSVAVTGPGGLSLTPAPIYASNIDAGTASASYTFAGDATHEGSTGSASFTIGLATSTVTVVCTAGAPYNYAGSPQTPCTAQATGVGIAPVDVTASLVYGNNTGAGGATASASWGGDTNHFGSNGSGGFTIGQASSTVTVACTVGAPYTYTGSAQTPCTATYATPDGLSGSLAVSYTANMNAGPATASASWTGDGNHTGSTGNGGFTIGLASSTVTVACTVGAPYTYTGSAQTPCTAQAIGVGMSPLNVSASLVYTGNINAGTAGATATYAGDGNHNPSTGAGGFTIARATPIFSGLSGPTISAGATPTVLAGTLKFGTLIPSGSVSITLNGVIQPAVIDSAAGTFLSSFVTGALTTTGSPYTITYSYAGDTNFAAAGPDTSKRLTVQGSYVLVSVKNMPPAAGVTFKPSSTGTAVDLDWKFTKSGVVVNSADAQPVVTISGPGGFSKTFSPGAGCTAANACTSFTYQTSANTWDLDWKPKNAAVGTYYVVVTSQKTGQRFPETGLGFPVVFK